MRKIKYICDRCGTEKEYKIQATNNPNAGQGMLLKILNKEYCRKCLKEIINKDGELNK